MSVPIFNHTYAIDFYPTDFLGFKTMPLRTKWLWVGVPLQSLAVYNKFYINQKIKKIR